MKPGQHARRVAVNSKGKKKVKIRNFLVPILRFLKPAVFLDKKKEENRKKCRSKLNGHN
jgi:hypothetical protein